MKNGSEHRLRARIGTLELLRRGMGVLIAIAIAGMGAWVLPQFRQPAIASAVAIVPARPAPAPAPAPVPVYSFLPEAVQPSAAEIFARCSPAVVRVFAYAADGARGQGSGFVLSSDGLIVTNYHVIDGKCIYQVALADDRLLTVDRVVAIDRAADLAMLKVQADALPTLALGSEKLPRIGDRVYAIGSPRDLSNTLSEGLVSGHRHDAPGLSHIQTTAPISPGSSGGPLLDAEGRVIGVTCAFRSDGQNLNFAVEPSRVRQLLEHAHFALQAMKAPGTARYWLYTALRHATGSDQTRPSVFTAIGEAALAAHDRQATLLAARLAQQAGVSVGDTSIWEFDVAMLFRRGGRSDLAQALLASTGLQGNDPEAGVAAPASREGDGGRLDLASLLPVLKSSPSGELRMVLKRRGLAGPELERALVQASSTRAAAGQIADACAIASDINGIQPRAQAMRAIARSLAPRMACGKLSAWIDQQGSGAEAPLLRTFAALGAVDAAIK